MLWNPFSKVTGKRSTILFKKTFQKCSFLESNTNNDANQETQIVFSGIIDREDNNYSEKIQESNTKLESYCKSNGFVFYKQVEIG